MEQFSRECLEIDSETHEQQSQQADRANPIVGSSMDRVYDRAAKLVKRTLDVEGVIVVDVSHCEVLENMNSEGVISVILHSGDPQVDAKEAHLTAAEFHQLNAFFAKHPDGKISEGIAPPCFRSLLPKQIQYALSESKVLFCGRLKLRMSTVAAVPIFDIDKRPFALLFAYNVTDQTKRYVRSLPSNNSLPCLHLYLSPPIA